MTQYLIMCRSLTYAQRAQKQLESLGITANVVKAPQGLNTSGCGYAVSVYRRAILSAWVALDVNTTPALSSMLNSSAAASRAAYTSSAARSAGFCIV